MRQLSLEELVELIEEPNRDACRRILEDHEALFRVAPGSLTKHQAWPGGYHDHVVAAMNKGGHEFDYMMLTRANDGLPAEEQFSLGDVMLVLFLHDIEKPWKYHPDAACPVRAGSIETKVQRRNFRWRMMERYYIRLTGNQMNAIEYVEGVRDCDHSSTNRTAWPLGVICHMADLWSAHAAYDLGRPN